MPTAQPATELAAVQPSDPDLLTLAQTHSATQLASESPAFERHTIGWPSVLFVAHPRDTRGHSFKVQYCPPDPRPLLRVDPRKIEVRGRGLLRPPRCDPNADPPPL